MARSLTALETREVELHMSGATAADEVHDLEVVAVIEPGFGPAVAGDDVTVQLNCYAVGFHAQQIYECGERERGWGVE